ncbi:hypothetical protein LV779_02620 [Streptomyces thinghirensis]|nr:hypothetical protein [Streptomyces thinghirensis]
MSRGALGTRRRMMKRALWQGGLLAGTTGVLAMTLGEKAEQRPDRPARLPTSPPAHWNA